jgi:cellulose synthase/poly-beta-1,6-N-acetylglucosamine synthase-like glycosyltransferase
MTSGWVFAGLSTACFALLLYPYLFYPAVLRLLSVKPVRRAPTSLSASLLLCAHNESDCLPDKILNLRELKRETPGLEILVYDDFSSDGTFDLLRGVPDLLTVFRGPGRTGKAAGMKMLVRQAKGDILLFTDADVRIAPDAVRTLLPYYADPEVGGVCCSIRMMSDGASATGEIGTLYWDLDDRLQQLESATGNVMGASGALFSVRRSLYPDFPDSAQDDFAASMAVILQGKRLIKATDVMAYTDGCNTTGAEVRRKMRIAAGAFHTHGLMRDRIWRMAPRDRFKYVSRKFMRWFGGAFAALSLLFAAMAVALLISPSAALLFLALAAIGTAASLWASSGILARVGEIVAATFATVAGVFQAYFGRTAATWTPVNSRLKSSAPSNVE